MSRSLYDFDGGLEAYQDHLTYLMGQFFNIEPTELLINRAELAAFASRLSRARQDFPYDRGYAEASAYKRAGWLVTLFMQHSPIGHAPLRPEDRGRIAHIHNWPNAMFSFACAQRYLRTATAGGASASGHASGLVALTGQLDPSWHSYIDFLEALGGLNLHYHDLPGERSDLREHCLVSHYKLISLTLEQMCYVVNPAASYPRLSDPLNRSGVSSSVPQHLAAKLTELEEAMWRAETRHNLGFQNTHFAPDFTEFGRSGRIYNRTEVVRSGGGVIEAQLPLDRLKLRMLDLQTVQLTYDSHVVYSGVTEHAHRSSIWSRSADGLVWQMRFHQGTPFEPI